MILLGYDGPDNAKDAIEHAGVLCKGQPAVVLVIWERYAEIVARAPAGFGRVAGDPDIERLDNASAEEAEQAAEEGANLARDAGLGATPRTSPRSGAMAATSDRQALGSAADPCGVRGSVGLS